MTTTKENDYDEEEKDVEDEDIDDDRVCGSLEGIPRGRWDGANTSLPLHKTSQIVASYFWAKSMGSDGTDWTGQY